MKDSLDPNDNTDIKLYILLLLYMIADGNGKINMDIIKPIIMGRLNFASNNKQVYISQIHVDVLMDYGIIPDIREIIEKMKNPPTKLQIKKPKS